jgi:hypothetical protein
MARHNAANDGLTATSRTDLIGQRVEAQRENT